MSEQKFLAERFERERPRLRAVAYRMLGSVPEADDAVQEAWLRLSRSDTSDVTNLGAWLTTIVARVALNMLQSRASRREELTDAPDVRAPAAGPEQETLLADSVGLALLVVLDTLTPAERLAFVLHDMFAVPFEEIAPIVDRSPAAARQLASRARRRIQRTGAGAGNSADGAQTREGLVRTKEGLVRAFLAASREGNFDALLAMLDPGIVMRADQVAVQIGASAEVCGTDAVARVFAGGAKAARLALIDGEAGLVWFHGGRPRVAFRFTVAGGIITAIDLQGDPADADITTLRSPAPRRRP
jgi:RNA polymerase sigma factor (sigma-70 family)